MDAPTLLLVNVVNQLVLATVLPIIMGRRLSDAARHARQSLVLQGLGWLALALSGLTRQFWLDAALSTLAMASLSASQWLLYRALEGWLGPRPWRHALVLAVVAMPVGYALAFASYPVRVSWSNGFIALQSILLARATLWPATGARGHWRWVLCGGLLIMAVLTTARGILGGFFTELYPSFLAPNPINLAALLAANVILALANMAILVAWHEEADQKLRDVAATDPLTGLLNRRGWADQAIAPFAHGLRHAHPVSLLMLDLDHFKRINDARGHEAGDAVLAAFGAALLHIKRSGDLVARLGGEEFGVLLPFCDAEDARAFDRRLRAELALADIAPGEKLDFSSGLAVQRASDDSLDSLATRADAALYRAKQQGRGRLVDADEAAGQG